MPRKKLVIPSFKTEKEEAVWWDQHQMQVESNLRAAIREKRTISLADVLARARQKEESRVMIDLPNEDVAVARKLATDQGVEYQTYIRTLLHEVLQKEIARQGRALRRN